MSAHPKTQADRDAVVDFAVYADQRVRVRLQGGREVEGVLKGFDKLDNMVLDETIEFLRGKLRALINHSIIFLYFLFDPLYLLDPKDLSQVTDKTRSLGLIVVRGTQVSLVSPSDEMVEIANPFAEEEEANLPVEEGEEA